MKLSRIAASILGIGLFSFSVLATAQDPDFLIYKGEKKMLFSNPLDAFYETGKKKRPEFMLEPFMVSSGNWRGYVATWEIDSGQLYLKDIESWLCRGRTRESCQKVALETIFPGKVRAGRVFADWFTGELRIPDGEQLRYVHSGYASIYERDIVFDVSKGNVGPPQVIDNTKAPTPSELQLMKAELAKLKAQTNRENAAARSKLRAIHIVPGEEPFKVGTPRKQLEKVVGKGVVDSNFDDVYFVEYPHYGVQASFENKTNKVHVILLYPGASNETLKATVKTDRGIGWNSTEDEVLAAYGKPLKDYSDESKSWRRLEYPGIDFKFGNGRLDRIGILGPDGN